VVVVYGEILMVDYQSGWSW